MILILTNKWDISADFVVFELRKRGYYPLRINTEDIISTQATINLPNLEITFTKNNTTYNLLHNTSVIWNRRPEKPFKEIQEDTELSKGLQKFVNEQWSTWLEALQLVRKAIWINHPQANYLIENKVRQLVSADSIGFNIPQTTITNDISQVKKLARSYEGQQIVAKALFSPLIEEPDQDFFIFANKIHLDDLSQPEEIRICPSIYQQCLYPKVDYRVTVIGDAVLTARIESDDSEKIDWRTDKDGAKFTQCQLPIHVEQLCREFIRTNGLLFGA